MIRTSQPVESYDWIHSILGNKSDRKTKRFEFVSLFQLMENPNNKQQMHRMPRFECRTDVCGGFVFLVENSKTPQKQLE
jgi:hypothetical protein